MIYLASRSPRRRALLAQLGVRFETLDVDIDETPRADESADALARRLAAGKAQAGRRCLDDADAHLVLGADTLTVRKPDPEHLNETARRIGADPALSVMLGDTRNDIETARNAGVPCVLTTFGFAADPLEVLKPDAVVDHFDEIPGLLERLIPRERPAERSTESA